MPTLYVLLSFLCAYLGAKEETDADKTLIKKTDSRKKGGKKTVDQLKSDGDSDDLSAADDDESSDSDDSDYGDLYDKKVRYILPSLGFTSVIFIIHTHELTTISIHFLWCHG